MCKSDCLLWGYILKAAAHNSLLYQFYKIFWKKIKIRSLVCCQHLFHGGVLHLCTLCWQSLCFEKELCFSFSIKNKCSAGPKKKKKWGKNVSLHFCFPFRSLKLGGRNTRNWAKCFRARLAIIVCIHPWISLLLLPALHEMWRLSLVMRKRLKIQAVTIGSVRQ